MNYKIIDVVVQNIDMGVFKYIGSESTFCAYCLLYFFLIYRPHQFLAKKMPSISPSHAYNTEFRVRVMTNKTHLLPNFQRKNLLDIKKMQNTNIHDKTMMLRSDLS